MFWNVDEKSVSKEKLFVKASSADVLSVPQSPLCFGIFLRTWISPGRKRTDSSLRSAAAALKRVGC